VWRLSSGSGTARAVWLKRIRPSFLAAVGRAACAAPLQAACDFLIVNIDSEFRELNFAISLGGEVIATGNYSGVVRVWSVSDGSPLQEISTGMGPIGNLTFIRKNTLAVVGTLGYLLVLNSEMGREIAHLRTHNLTQGVLDVSRGGKTLVTGSGDGSLKLVDTDKLLTLRGHGRQLFSIAVSSDGKTIASGGLPTCGSGEAGSFAITATASFRTVFPTFARSSGATILRSRSLTEASHPTEISCLKKSNSAKSKFKSATVSSFAARLRKSSRRKPSVFPEPTSAF